MKREARILLFQEIDVYPVTCERLSQGRSNLEVLKGVIQGGSKIIQLREKHYSKRDFYNLALKFREITSRAGVLLIINDHVLVDVLSSMQFVFSAELKRRNIALTMQCDIKPTINVDVNLFEQVLINIIKNALEAIDENGEISIVLTEVEHAVSLRVRDSAGALSDQDKLNVFKPFYTRKPTGQGVGLMLAREILDQHGFHYQLESVPGEWTEFRIDMNAKLVDK